MAGGFQDSESDQL